MGISWAAGIFWRGHKGLPIGRPGPGRTRTCNLWLRRPTPYPLGHRALNKLALLDILMSARLYRYDNS
eukprot:3318928-Prorocentrum_lima.AAC.1